MENNNKEKLIIIKNKIYLLSKINDALVLLQVFSFILFLAVIASSFIVESLMFLGAGLLFGGGSIFVKKIIRKEKCAKSQIIFKMARDSRVDDCDITLQHGDISFRKCYNDKKKVLVKKRYFWGKR